MCSISLAKERAQNLKDDASRVINYLNVGDINKAQYILTDMKEGIKLIGDCK